MKRKGDLSDEQIEKIKVAVRGALLEHLVSAFRLHKTVARVYIEMFDKNLDWRLKDVKIGNESKPRPR